MKRTIIIFLLLLFGVCSAQTYLKVADREEYKLYENWCKVLVERHLEINVKIKLQAVDGIYYQDHNKWVAAYPFVGSLVKIGAVPVVNQDEKLIQYWTLVKVWRRTPTIADFYTNWNKIKLEYGLAGS